MTDATVSDVIQHRESAADDPSRVNRAVSWIVWYLPELAGVLVSAGFAVAVSPWVWLVSGVVAAKWAVREVRPACRHAAIRASRDLPDASGADAPSIGSDVDTSGTGDESLVDQISADDVEKVSL